MQKGKKKLSVLLKIKKPIQKQEKSESHQKIDNGWENYNKTCGKISTKRKKKIMFLKMDGVNLLKKCLFP